jgi:excisionase family DNA binding protein
MRETTKQLETAVGIADEGFATVDEAMEFLGLCRASVYKHMDAGQLAYAKFGRARRIPKRALREFAAGCVVVA